MTDNKLVASLVVFKELLDSDKDIYDIIAEFIKACVELESIWAFSSTEMTECLKQIFDFEIPEAVVKTALRKKMVASGIITKDQGKYIINQENEALKSNINLKHAEKLKIYSEIENKFISHMKSVFANTNKKLDESEIRNELNHYLLGSNGTGKYTPEISAYIIKNKNDIDFMEKLNVIREGLVLYTGILYTSDLNELGVWKNKLTIYLDTDILFNLSGLNGLLYQEIFNDFYKLVKEINLSSKKQSNEKRIELKYFSETEAEIHNFFHVASLIVERKKALNPSKIAMNEIINGCSTKSDVIVKKNKFFMDLQTKGIQLEETRNYYENSKYIVEGHSVLEDLEQISEDAKREFDEEKCKDYLQQFTKINLLRKGISNLGFNKCGYVIVTGNRFAHYLSKSPKIRENARDIPFAIDIDFVTDKFWFKLKKGFGSHEALPKSFEIITKAQIVLSSQISNTVHEKYTALHEKYKSGELSKKEVISLNYELRESSIKPEDIVYENVQETLDFVNEFSIENHLREQTILRKKAAEGEKAKEELHRRDRKELSEKIKSIKNKFRFYYYLKIAIICSAVIGVFYMGYKIVDYLKEPGDSTLSIIGFVLGLISLLPILYLAKKVDTYIRKKARRNLKEDIHELCRKN